VSSIDADAVALAVASVRERIRRVVNERTVELIAVTKGFGVDAIHAAVAAGCSSIGENYAQELRDKVADLAPGTRLPTVHFIGQLQSNKVKMIAPMVDVWQSVDRASLAEEIARRSPGATVFVQVNSTAEETKGGCAPATTQTLVEHCRLLELQVLGLMTVGPTVADAAKSRAAFSLVRRLADDVGLAGCSMGMTDDLEIALEQGATHVRVGSALFGERPSRRTQMR
jgi:pyridoxal phosphate enzyme (YggS family)